MKVFSLLNFFLVYVASEKINKCHNVKNFNISDEYSVNRLTSITTDGNYTIQALTTFTTGEPGCNIVHRDGLVRTYAIKYAIDLANNNTQLRKYAKIGMRLDDDCASLPITMARGIEIISLIRENSVCRAEFLQCSSSTEDSSYVQAAAGIIGTSMSFTTIPLASLMSLYLIPQISFSASSRLLSKVDLYKSFFRTIPSDVNQISVMLDVIEEFKWNYIFAIGSDDDYGKLGISELESRARNRSICITETHYVAYKSQSTLSRVTSIVQSMKANSKALVVVLFCYVDGLGDLILDEAKRAGVKRIWLTSDAWNPPAMNLNVTLKDQAHGILSVSLKSHKLPNFVNYMSKEIQTDFLCNMWLQNFLKNTYKCEPFDISPNKSFLIGNNCTIKISEVMKELSNLPGKTSNLIDAVTVLTHAIQTYLDINCNSDTSCSIATIDYANLTNIVKSVTFNNSLNELIKFDVNGDPEFIFYTIENLQFINKSFQYIPVGNWSKTRVNKSLLINKLSIKWPSWFNLEQNTSRCSEDCDKGQYVTARIGCCWKCENCTDNNYSNTKMAETCKTCDAGNHTEDHIVCKVTPIKWLKYSDTEGIAIIVVSFVGLLLNVLACILLLKLRSFLSPDGSLLHILLSCILPFLTFIFGFLYIVKPTVYLCHSRNVIFFLLLMAYSSILMIKTKITRNYLESHFDFFKGHLFLKQTVLMMLLVLVEVGSIIAWIVVDSKKNIVQEEQVNYEIQRRCFVDFTAARLVSTFIPFILLIVATCCAFQERNNEHPFYEPKFLSFTTIALCIITVAFLPTFKYVKGNFKGIVMVFTTCVFGFTYMACLILPKIYVVHTRKNRKDSFAEPYIKPSKVLKPDNNEQDEKETTTTSDIKPKKNKLTSSQKSSIET